MNKPARGRPTLYRVEYAEQARKYCLLGATDEQLATFFDVNVDTIHEWKHRHAEFSEALREGKDIADSQVADRLYKRATGYTHDAVKIFANPNTGAQQIVPYTEYYAPDTTACIFWLKNRQKDRWRDSTSINSNNQNVNINQDMADVDVKSLEDDELKQLAILLQKAVIKK